jgi:hypothetical protein
MFAQKTVAQKRVRATVKSAKRLVNDALDRAEPRLEEAAASLEVLGKDAMRAARRASDRGLAELKTGYSRVGKEVAAGYGRLEKKVRKASRRSDKVVRRNPGKAALVTAGLVTLAIGLLR